MSFRAGGLYAYLDVPPEAHEALMAAASKGAYFQACIEPRFRYVRLDETAPAPPTSSRGE